MKIGDIVKTEKGKIGMIVYRKGNGDIGVNMGHYHLSLYQKPELTPKERAKYLKGFGIDEMFEKSELKLLPEPPTAD